jgi:hypothetical protein
LVEVLRILPPVDVSIAAQGAAVEFAARDGGLKLVTLGRLKNSAKFKPRSFGNGEGFEDRDIILAIHISLQDECL